MKIFVYTLLATLPILAFACHAKNNPNPPVSLPAYPEPIPVALQNQVEHTLDVTCQQRKDYSTTYWSFFDSTYTPQQAYTDINNDGRIDYAWIVAKDNQVRIAIALSDQDSYQYWISPFFCEDKKSTGIQTSITPQPAGRKDIMQPTIQSLELKNNGFLIQMLEQEKYILYVNDSGSVQVFNM
jgi:hypothetical protein